MTVTPSIAKSWLEKNTGNRNLNPIHVTELACAMLDDEWRENGEAIKLSRNGRVLDGQHRLHAIVESGRSITTAVFTDLPEEIQDTIDLGMKRTIGDALHMEGVANSVRVGGALRFLDAYLRGTMRLRRLSPTMAKGLLQQHPGIEDACRLPNTPLVSPSTMGAFHYLASCKDAALAENLASHIIRGEPTDHSAFRALREKLIAAPYSDNATRRKAFLFMAKAWNYARAGRKISVLREPTEAFIQLL